MVKHFRNDEQQKAFDEWWNGYMKQYFGEVASRLAGDDEAMWVIGIAYQAGLEAMAHRVQDSLSFATVVTIK